MKRIGSTNKSGAELRESLRCNEPKRTPNHPTKWGVVLACIDGVRKLIRFGEQGAYTAGSRTGEAADKRRKAFKARHAKNIAKGKSSPAWWADKYRW